MDNEFMHVHKSLIRFDDDGEYVTILIKQIPDSLEAVDRVRELIEQYERFGKELDRRMAAKYVFQGVAKQLNEALGGNQ